MLDNIISTKEAGEMWGLSPAYVKKLAANGLIQAKKIGPTWVIVKEQPNPKKEK